MSEKEFEQGTEELFGVVNDHASDTAKLQAERIARQAREAEFAVRQAELEREKAAIRRNKRTEKVLGLILRLLVCALAAVLFLAALLMPEWVPVLCFTGLGVCLIVGTVVVGRFRNAWR